MFLLSCLEGELTLAQLADIAALAGPGETERRVETLCRLGLVEARASAREYPLGARAGAGERPEREQSGPFRAPAHALETGTRRKFEPEPETLRPPPGSLEVRARLDEFESRQTLVPARGGGPLTDRITPLRPPPLDALFQAESTGALLKLLEPEREDGEPGGSGRKQR
jgi:hypothetical protein